jgi:hypothetical protein
VYSLVGQFQSTAGGVSSTLTRTPATGAGAFLVITYLHAASQLTISSITNQASTAIPYTQATFTSWNFGAGIGYGQALVWIPAFPSGTTSTVLTMNTSSDSTTLYFYQCEYTGLTNSLTIDAQAGQNQSSVSGSANAVTSGTASPSGAATGAIVFGMSISYSAYESNTAGTGFGNYLAFDPAIGVLAAGAIEDMRTTINNPTAATFTAATAGNSYGTQMLIIDEAPIPATLAWIR